MVASRFSRVLSVGLLLALSACATQPENINNICAVFDQRDGWFNDWQSGAQRAERKYGVPVPVLMATLRKESGFQADAKPPRTKLFGFIPWKRPSTAYGYSQALDGTWAQYQRETGNTGARRTSFADAVDFVGWYHSKSSDTLGIARNDTYNLYLAYYLGWGGYKRGDWQSNAPIRKYARSTDEMARDYAAQMRQCRAGGSA
ncbi:MAG: hypothetical protein KKB66_09755 [Alphaproteobacteria bacterium]|jgi:hypothetical protein|nr:hypothetical protein [Alphaproteobacteria bacterium]MBU0804772.1 hypothetical protein [Alphaproteobacteria bacterium]MBU0871719.1 hypothetical protein [Alphaproteobacteria bacterium]MBU1403472.1 hypothetical protein [Alphaproteobacteria bacterium]MBU1591448.1 hypothetical protein [Alphaproteobacteria bacterium]